MLGDAMNIVAVVWIVVGVVTLVTLLIFLISLVRQVQRLSRSVIQFQRDLKPVLESIQRDAATAQEHSERVQAKVEQLRAVREGDGRGRSRARARR